MTWCIDFTTRARQDLVGLDAGLMEAVTDTLVGWLAEGPPRQSERVLAGVRFYEASVADRVILGYTVKRGPASIRTAVGPDQAWASMILSGLSRGEWP